MNVRPPLPVFVCVAVLAAALLVCTGTAATGDVLTVVADAFYSPLYLNRGERVRFMLSGGQVREIELVDCGLDIRDAPDADPRKRQWTLWAQTRIDGAPFRLLYSPFDMKALYRPKVVNGMRIALDGVQGMPDVFPEARDKNRTTGQAQPPAHVRLWVNDATRPLLPNCHPWFDLARHRRKEAGALRAQDFWLRQDKDIHPGGAAPDSNLKTGFLGYWGYGVHVGLDLNLKTNTPLFCVADGGIPQSRSPMKKNVPPSPDRTRYVVRSANGDEWWFYNAHCERLIAPTGMPMKAGEVYANSGTQRAGSPHAHTELSMRRADGTEFFLNPWPVMWQGFENARLAAGFPQARIAPLGPVATGEPVEFRAEPALPSGGPALAWQWIFDDGTRTNGPTVRKTFASPGLHQAILIVRTDKGFDLDEQFVTVGHGGPRGPVLKREITALPRLPVAEQQVAFMVGATRAEGRAIEEEVPPLTFTWDFGDGATATGATVEHAFAASGWYYVTVRVFDPSSGAARLDWYGLEITPTPARRQRPAKDAAHLDRTAE